MYKKTTLDNGLRIVTHRMAERQSFSMGIWIKAGGRYETTQNKGISHFLEHLLFKGSKKYSCAQIKETIEGVGGALNGFTSEELTCYLVKIPSRHMELALDVLSDMVLNPSLPQDEIEKEKTVILEEIKMYKDQPQSYVYDLLDELMWPGQPLGEPVIGTSDSVSAITREEILAFKNAYYCPSNIVVSAAGTLSHDALAKKIGKIFSHRDPGTKSSFKKVEESQAKAQLKVFNKATEQTHMALGFHSLEREHPLKHALALLHIILGANMSSRLFNELREKRGLAYEIGTGLKRYDDTGAFIVHAGIDNTKVVQALSIILGELKKIAQELVTQDEFKRAKDFYLGQLMLALEDTLDHMLWIGETAAALNKIYTIKDIVKGISKVTRADIRKVAGYIFKDEKLSASFIGPLENSEGSIKECLNLN